MIDKLVEFGKTLRDENSHDALTVKPMHIEIIIDEQGNFHSFIDCPPNITTICEALIGSKKGKSILLVDKLEETLNFDSEKHKLYIEKLNLYKNIDRLKPVFSFYGDNKFNGLDKAKDKYEKDYRELHKKSKSITRYYVFRLINDSKRFNEYREVIEEIKIKYEENQNSNRKREICSICGKTDYPISYKSHGYINNVPNGRSESVLISYNEDAFMSYSLYKNLNSFICDRCAKNYTNGFNELLNNKEGKIVTNKKGEEFRKSKYAKVLGNGAAILFWLRNRGSIKEIDYLEDTEGVSVVDNKINFDGTVFSLFDNDIEIETRVDAFKVGILDSVEKRDGHKTYEKTTDVEKFYAMIISGESARIAIRSWNESTAGEVKTNITKWFDDIRINAYGQDNVFFTISQLVRGITLEWHTGNPIKKNREEDIHKNLWLAALFGKKLPYILLKEVISSVYSARYKDKKNNENKKVGVLPEQVVLLKLILKRGEFYMDSNKKDEMEIAYSFGKIFALYERIQKVALGTDLNSGIAERYFTSACTTPSRALGKIGDLGKKHISKISKDKKGLALYYEKELGKIMPDIKDLPALFSLEARAKFIIGYYSQCQERTPKKEELDEAIEN